MRNQKRPQRRPSLRLCARLCSANCFEQESKTTAAHSAYEQAKMERQTNDQLAKNGLVAELVYKTSKIKEEECQKRAMRSSKSAWHLRAIRSSRSWPRDKPQSIKPNNWRN